VTKFSPLFIPSTTIEKQIIDNNQNFRVMDTNNSNERFGNTGTNIDSVNSIPEDFIPYNEHEFMGTYPGEINPDFIEPTANENQHSPKNHDYESTDDKPFRNINHKVIGNYDNDGNSTDDDESGIKFTRNNKP